MLDSSGRMYNLYSILFTFGSVSFFVYGLLFRKDRIISFYQFHVSYNHFDDIHTLYQLCCINRYLYVIHLYVFHFSEWLCECVCVPVYILLCMNALCMYVFIVGQ